MSDVFESLHDVLPRRNDSIELADFLTELVVLDTRTNDVHLITGAVAIVLDRCDGVSLPAHLSGDLGAALGLSESESEALVGDCLAELARLGLLEGTKGAGPPPCIGCNGRRRRRRLGGHRHDPDKSF